VLGLNSCYADPLHFFLYFFSWCFHATHIHTYTRFSPTPLLTFSSVLSLLHFLLHTLSFSSKHLLLSTVKLRLASSNSLFVSHVPPLLPLTTLSLSQDMHLLFSRGITKIRKARKWTQLKHQRKGIIPLFNNIAFETKQVFICC